MSDAPNATTPPIRFVVPGLGVGTIDQPVAAAAGTTPNPAISTANAATDTECLRIPVFIVASILRERRPTPGRQRPPTNLFRESRSPTTTSTTVRVDSWHGYDARGVPVQ